MNDCDTRLRAILGVPAANRLLERLRTKLGHGALLTGTVSIAKPTEEEKQHFASIFGRSVTRSTMLRVDLDELSTLLRNANLAADVQEAVVRLIGVVPNRRAAKDASGVAWREVYARLEEMAQRDGRLAPWAEAMRAQGLLKRLASSSTERAIEWIEGFGHVWSRLPLAGAPLARLAADALGDAHALDAGQTLPALLLRAIPALGEPLPGDDLSPAERRRELWAAAGVLSDELSGAVLVLNLPAEPTNATGQLLRTAHAAGEPLYLTLRQLLRTPPTFSAGNERTVFVCENPTVLAAAANELGAECAPLVCVLGQLRQSAHRLLRQFTAINWRLAYHGDFDWPGIRISNLVLSRHRATAWRMSADDYRIAPAAKVRLEKASVVATWDPTLMPAMQSRGRAVFEEQVLDSLLKDLGAGLCER